MLPLPEVLQLCQEQSESLYLLICALERLYLALHKLLGLLKEPANVLHIDPLGKMLSWRWSRDRSLAGLSLSLIDRSLRDAELLCELSHLLAICAESQAKGAKVEDTRPGPWLFVARLDTVLPILALRGCSIGLRLLPLRLRSAAETDAKSGNVVLPTARAVSRDRSPARRTHLLSLEPALETTKV